MLRWASGWRCGPCRKTPIEAGRDQAGVGSYPEALRTDGQVSAGTVALIDTARRVHGVIRDPSDRRETLCGRPVDGVANCVACLRGLR